MACVVVVEAGVSVVAACVGATSAYSVKAKAANIVDLQTSTSSLLVF